MAVLSDFAYPSPSSLCWDQSEPLQLQSTFTSLAIWKKNRNKALHLDFLKSISMFLAHKLFLKNELMLKVLTAREPRTTNLKKEFLPDFSFFYYAKFPFSYIPTLNSPLLHSANLNFTTSELGRSAD
jgi:hypothetical protein